MGKINLFKLILFILVIGLVSYVLFRIADANYTSPEKEASATNLYLISNKDTVFVHDTIVHVKKKNKIVKICCCSHDSVSCVGFH